MSLKSHVPMLTYRARIHGGFIANILSTTFVDIKERKSLNSFKNTFKKLKTEIIAE